MRFDLHGLVARYSGLPFLPFFEGATGLRTVIAEFLSRLEHAVERQGNSNPIARCRWSRDSP